MRWSQYLIPTLKENPQEALIKSHRLMLRAGLIRKLASGTYTYLPLGLRALKKAENIVRAEMDRAGALEILMPAIHPAELWKESGRLGILGEDMVHFKDRHGKENVLGPTHEEVVTDLARREIHSYKQLPATLYQIQTKFRDEIRPRSGVIRSREFLMKDAYSFHASQASLDETYNRMKEVYNLIFKRCGLDFHVVQADPGAMGGSGSQEFVLFSDAGEDRMVQIADSNVVVSIEMASRKQKGPLLPKGQAPGRHHPVDTPGHSSVEGVAHYLSEKLHRSFTLKNLVKTMIYETYDPTTVRLFAVLVRGDHEVSEFKLNKFGPISTQAPAMASKEKIEKKLNSAFGFTGPIGLNIPLYIDEDVLEMKDFVVGANEEGRHLIDVNVEDILKGRSLENVFPGDFRQVVEGDLSPDGKPLRFRTAIELGHIFKLNLHYSKPMKARFLDEKGKENSLLMGCYGIGINRILAAAIEQHSDEKGIIWPKNISPFQVLVVMIEPEDTQSKQIVENLLSAKELKERGIDVLVDDRPESAGVKFNDADLIGIPLRVVLGPKNLKSGKAEIKSRRTGEMTLVEVSQLIIEIIKQLDKLT